MTIPFLHLFKGKAKEQPARVPFPKPALVAEKPSSERLSKTVLPSATRTVSAPDPFHVGARSSSMENGNGVSSTAVRTISLNSPAPRTSDLPPALALALEPKVERVISLELGDVVPQMPSGWVKALNEEDASRRVLLKAAELERGMANGNPSVSIATIYRQVPEIFLRPVEASDNAQVRLPFAKVLEQFTNLQLRSDQYREQSVPQFETPFLKVTLEDNDRFGTTTEALQTADLPPVRVQPATADSIAAAEPEPAAQEKVPATAARFPIQFPVQTGENENGFERPAPDPERGPPAAPARIPFKLSPIGTDVPASESVPASNGASVPTSLPAPGAPTRIPFKVSAPSVDLRPKAEPWLTKESFGMEPKTGSAPDSTPAPHDASNGHRQSTEVTISLPLKPILNALPPFQLTADISDVPEETRVELPFSLVELQLASGRVCIMPEDFAAALPAHYRAFFTSKDIAAPVALPLHEVLKNLPVASLQMREDQEEQEVGANFATPFSAKAEEDAKRFNVSSSPVAKSAINPVVSVAAAPALALIPEAVQEPANAKVELPRAAELPAVLDPPRNEPAAEERTGLQELFETDDEIDAKAVAARVSQMPGLRACAIMFRDGLNLAGNLPEELHADGLCALAPSMLERLENHLVETQLGALRAMTFSCANAAFTFLMKDNLCLAALHAAGALTPETVERLGRIVQELAKKYSHPV